MINFFASHIPNMSVTTPLLRDLLKFDVHFQWDLQHDGALTKIKEVISFAPILSYFDPSKTKLMLAPVGEAHHLCLMKFNTE